MRRRITQSSLPDSLIPHLYSAPQQRQSHNHDNDDHQNFDIPPVTQRPIYSDPVFYSSNTRLPSIARRGSSLPPPPRLTPPPPPPSLLQPQPQQQQQHRHHHHNNSYHDLLPPPHTIFQDYEESYTSSLASLSISAPTSSSSVLHRFPDSPESHQPEDSHTPPNNPRNGSRKGKKRQHSPDPDDNTKKSRNPRKTLVACNFCRGRKLRCNGARPVCYNCSIRNAKKCEYVPVQRRRGPGRAPRGSRTRRAGPSTSRTGTNASRSDPADSSAGPSRNIPYELESLAPEVRPYTSVMTFDPPSTIFTFRPPTPPLQPPLQPPPQPQPQPGPSRQISQHHFSFSPEFHDMQQPHLLQQQQHHHYRNDSYHHHHIRNPRSRETSSEDLEEGRSDIEEFYRQRYGS